MLGPGDVEGSVIGESLARYVQGGHLPHGEGGACITDARDVALAMITAAERGVSGEFEVLGPYVTFEDLADILAGRAQSRTSVAIPELAITFRPVEETIGDVVAWQRYGAASLVCVNSPLHLKRRNIDSRQGPLDRAATGQYYATNRRFRKIGKPITV